MKQVTFRVLNAEDRANNRRRRLHISVTHVNPVLREPQRPLLNLGRVLEAQLPELATMAGKKAAALNLIHA